MMKAFQIKSISDFFLFLTAFASLIVMLILLPAGVTLVTWNAIIFESFSGPEIDFTQSLILWAMVMLVIKLLFNPTIEMDFKKMDGDHNGKNDPDDMGKPSK